MHIILIHQAFATASEAGGTRHYEFAQYLAERGHRITVIAGSVSYLTGKLAAGRHEEPFPGLEVIRPRSSVKFHKSFRHRLMAYLEFTVLALWGGIRVRNPDVVLGTSPPLFQGLAALLVARIKRVPFIFEVRDLWPDFAIQLGVVHNRMMISWARVLERNLYKAADHLIVNSPGFIHHIQNVSGRTPTIIPNGVDPSMFEPSRPSGSVREEWGAHDRFVVLYAGAHGIANDLDCLLDAAKLLRTKREVLFILVGDGKEKSRLCQRAKKEDLGNVVFMPAQPKKRMAEILHASDACVAILRNIPLFGTTYPNKVFDYMAAGKPVILAIDGVIREVVQAADSGIFVQPGNAEALAAAVRTLTDDTNLARNMGTRARDYVCRHFDRKEQAKLLETLLRTCVDKAGV